MIRLVDIILERMLGDKPKTLYYFRGLEGAYNILSTGTLDTSNTHLALDRDDNQRPSVEADRYVSFTTKRVFDDGFPTNQRNRKASTGASGEQVFKNIDYFPLVRFTIDVKILEELVEQATGDTELLDYVMKFSDKDIARDSARDEAEKRLWLKLRKVRNFTKCITEICFADFHVSSIKFNKKAIEIKDLADKLNIPCFVDYTLVRSQGKVEKLDSAKDLYKAFGGGYQKDSVFSHALGSKSLEKVCGIVAVCSYRFLGDSAKLFDFLGRRFGNVEDFQDDEIFNEFLKGVDSVLDIICREPGEIKKIVSNSRFVFSREFDGSSQLRQAIETMVERTCKQLNVQTFSELGTLIRKQIEKEMQ